MYIIVDENDHNDVYEVKETEQLALVSWRKDYGEGFEIIEVETIEGKNLIA